MEDDIRQLLSEALHCLDGVDTKEAAELRKKIRTYLAPASEDKRQTELLLGELIKEVKP